MCAYTPSSNDRLSSRQGFKRRERTIHGTVCGNIEHKYVHVYGYKDSKEEYGIEGMEWVKERGKERGICVCISLFYC